MKSIKTVMTHRREFLAALAGGTGMALLSGPATSRTASASEKGDEKVKSRYRESDHIRTFYRVNSYPTK